MRRLAWLALAVACTSGTTGRPRPSAPRDDLLAAIEHGDPAAALTAICAGYARRGLECSEALRIEALAPNDVMSRAWTATEVVALQPMPGPGGGYAYWENWSNVLANGRWQVRTLFASDDEARQVANLLLASVLAHELGHQLADAHRCALAGQPDELVADELSVPVFRELVAGRLAPLQAKLRDVTSAMIAQVSEVEAIAPRPGDELAAWASRTPSPNTPRLYAALHLARQRAVASRPDNQRCLDAFRAALAHRDLLPARVHTEQRREHATDHRAAFDPAGRLYAIRASSEDSELVLHSLDDGVTSRIEVDEPADVDDLAVFSATRFAVLLATRIYAIDTSTHPPRVETYDRDRVTALAFDPEGTLYAARVADGRWQVLAVATHTTRWSGTTQDRHPVDGPLATARLSVRRFAITDRALVTTDGRSLRIVEGERVHTLAGGARGRRDGDGRDAKLSRVDALAVGPAGTIRIVETQRTSWILRTLTRPGR